MKQFFLELEEESQERSLEFFGLFYKRKLEIEDDIKRIYGIEYFEENKISIKKKINA